VHGILMISILAPIIPGLINLLVGMKKLNAMAKHDIDRD